MEDSRQGKVYRRLLILLTDNPLRDYIAKWRSTSHVTHGEREFGSMTTSDHLPAMLRPTFLGGRWGRFLVILSFWTGIAIVTAILSHTRMVSLEQPSNFYKWLADSILAWYGWAALTPLILWLSHRFLPTGPHLKRNLLIFVAAGVVLSAGQIFYQCLTSMMIMGEPMEKYLGIVTAQLAWLGPWNFLVYAGIVGVGYAREFQQRWRERQVAAGKLEIELARAQVAALRSQIQPHFFFNTLNSIAVLIQKGDAGNAQKMLSRLGDLLRFSFSVGNRQTIPLRDEIAFVTGYLEIEQVRFGDRLKTEITVDPSCQDTPVPPFLIQPLVENSVKHGLAEKSGPGMITIRCLHHDRTLHIDIEDDGVGVSGQSRHQGAGVGISNVRSRLLQLYGSAGKLTIAPRAAGGTRVSIEIPDDSYREDNGG
ncbi:MAG: histidine kinase [Candidatus Zixiibacteriota bacterium]